MCPIKSIVRFGARVGLGLLCPHRMIPARLCYPPGARLYHYHTCWVVVHSWSLQGLINHEWGASPTDVGQRCQAKMATRQSPWPEVKILDSHTRGRETKPCGLGSPKRTMSLWGKIPHNTNIRFKAKNNNNMKVKKLKCWCGIEKAK